MEDDTNVTINSDRSIVDKPSALLKLRSTEFRRRKNGAKSSLLLDCCSNELDLTMFPQTIYFQMAICYPMIVRESVELLIIQVDKNPRSSKIFVAPSLSSSFITHSVPRAELHLSFSRPQDMWNTSPIHLRV